MGFDQTVYQNSIVDSIGSFIDPGITDTHDILWDFGEGSVVEGNYHFLFLIVENKSK